MGRRCLVLVANAGQESAEHILIDTTLAQVHQIGNSWTAPRRIPLFHFERRERYRSPDAPGLGYSQREVDVFMLEDLYDSRVPGGAVGFLADIVALSKMYVADIFHSLSWSLLFI